MKHRLFHVSGVIICIIFFLALSAMDFAYDRHFKRNIFIWIGLLSVSLAFCGILFKGKRRLIAFYLIPLCLFGGSLVYMATAPSYSDLQTQGESIIKQIEQFHSAEGYYPASLEEAGINRPKTRYGYWEYSSKGPSFFLSIGEYNKDLFTMYWSNTNREWYIDS